MTTSTAQFDTIAKANAFRRYLISGVSTYAICPDDIIIETNKTRLDNDMIRHRLSMIPVDHYQEVSVTIECKNTTTEVMYICSGSEHFKCSGWILPDTLLIILLPNEELKLTAHSSMGQGKDHTRWNITRDIQYKRDIKTIVKDISPEEQELIDNRLSNVNLQLDTNLHSVVNELVGRTIVYQEKSKEIQIEFNVINNATIKDITKQIEDQIQTNLKNFKINTDNTVDTDYAIVGLLLDEYLVQYPDTFVSCFKAHPLDNYFVVKGNSNKLMNVAKKLIGISQ
jgi:DNA-directed RNA polymerase alpha subunit